MRGEDLQVYCDRRDRRQGNCELRDEASEHEKVHLKHTYASTPKDMVCDIQIAEAAHEVLPVGDPYQAGV